MSAWIRKYGPLLMPQLLAGGLAGIFSAYVSVKQFAVEMRYTEQGIAEAKACCQAAQSRIDNFLLRGGG